MFSEILIYLFTGLLGAFLGSFMYSYCYSRLAYVITLILSIISVIIIGISLDLPFLIIGFGMLLILSPLPNIISKRKKEKQERKNKIILNYEKKLLIPDSAINIISHSIGDVVSVTEGTKIYFRSIYLNGRLMGTHIVLKDFIRENGNIVCNKYSVDNINGTVVEKYGKVLLSDIKINWNSVYVISNFHINVNIPDEELGQFNV